MPRRREVGALPRLLSRVLAAYYRAPDHAFKLRIFGLAMAWLGNRRLTLRYARTGWLTVDVADLVAREILATGDYEPEIWEALQPHLHPGTIVWDVGGHIGSFTIRALQDQRVRWVHVFEPDPALDTLVRHHLELNRSAATLHEFALLDVDGPVRFTAAPAANRGIGRVHRNGTLEIQGRTADTLVYRDRLAPPAIMKIDVEESEAAVLQGAARLLRENPPLALVIELPWDVEKGRLVDSDGVRILQSHGYHLEVIERPGGYRESRENVLALRDRPTTPR